MSDVYRPTWTGEDKQDRENEAIAQALAQKTKVPIWNKAPERFPYGEIFIAPGAPAFDPGQGPGLYYGSQGGTYARLDVLGNTLLGVYDQTTDTPTLVCSPDPQVVLAGDYWICTANGACVSACANINGLVAGPGDSIVWSGTAWELIATSGAYLSSQIADTANGHITLLAGGTSNTTPTLPNNLARKTEVDAAIAHSDAADVLQDAAISDLSDELEVLSGSSIALSLEKQVITLDTSGDPAYAEVEALGGGDMHYYMDDGVVATLNCTTGPGTGGKARVALVPGININSPTVNYIYVQTVGDVATLYVTDTSYPVGAFAWVGKVNIPDLVSLQTTGPYLLQRFTEAFDHGGRGALSYQREKLRIMGAVYSVGGAHSLFIDDAQTPDSVHLQVAAAVVYQLHRQDFPAFITGPYQYGNGQNPYEQFSDINEALQDANGDSLSNKYYNLVFWGAVNQDAGTCALYCNLPYGSYNNENNATADNDATADYTLPPDMRTVGFLICRATLKHGSAGGGSWSSSGLFSLLGVQPGIRAGGSAAAVSNEFSDVLFRITDDGDETAKIAFQASQIATSAVRTITMPDHNVDLGAMVWAGYMHMGCPADSAFSDLDITYQKLTILTLEEFSSSGFVVDVTNARFQFSHKGIYRFSLSGAMEHNSSNSGREFSVVFYDATNDVDVGTPYPIGTGRNAEVTNLAINNLFEVADSMIGIWIEIYIGGGDTYSLVSFPAIDFSANNVGEWRETL